VLDVEFFNEFAFIRSTTRAWELPRFKNDEQSSELAERDLIFRAND